VGVSRRGKAETWESGSTHPATLVLASERLEHDGSSPAIGLFLYLAQSGLRKRTTMVRVALSAYFAQSLDRCLQRPSETKYVGVPLSAYIYVAQTTHNTHKRRTSIPRWDSNSQSQQARGRIPPGHWDRRSIAPTHRK
jgi:hypothetical protein